MYDGHGGAGCADYLRNELHHKIIENANFPLHPHDAIREGCAIAERDFMKKVDHP